jgi:hypothetical protein
MLWLYHNMALSLLLHPLTPSFKSLYISMFIFLFLCFFFFSSIYSIYIYLRRDTINSYSPEITPFYLTSTLQKIQFPFRSVFSMTVNKLQGFVSIYLNEALFSHGQLYVAMSRVSSMDNLYIATYSDPESIYSY